MYVADPVDGDMVVANASHWAFAGTGLRNGDRLTGLLGYEVDAVSNDPPAGIERLMHSPFAEIGHEAVEHRSGTAAKAADATVYTAPSGALVFATGSMQWNWGLDDYNAPAWHPDRVNRAAQQITRNVLARMLATPAAPATRSPYGTSPIVLAAAAIAAAFVVRAWIRRPVRIDRGPAR